MLSFLVLTVVTPVFAQPEEAGAAVNWEIIGFSIAMAFAASICGLAQAKAIAAIAEGVARNPGAAATLRLMFFIGLAFIESLAIYALLVVLIGVFVV